MEVITIDMITGAIYSLAGLSALVVVLTQIFKNWWNKSGKRWVNHLLSFFSAILCNGAVLAIGLIWGVGMYADFDVNSFMSWLMIIGTTAGCGLVANGLWSYSFMKTFLEWLKLMPKPEPIPEIDLANYKDDHELAQELINIINSDKKARIVDHIVVHKIEEVKEQNLGGDGC